MAANVLYLSFDGMTDPLGRSQVLPYLAGLAARGHKIRIVSLEKAEAWRAGRDAVEAICRDAGLSWHPLPYRSSPQVLSGMANLRALRRAAERIHREQPADFVHCRADLPAIAGLAMKRRYGLPLLYDMRSFWADERAEGGQWDQSRWLYRLLFRYFKKRQRELLAEADEVVTLSEAGRRAIESMSVRPADAPVTVIPCCADFELFVPPSAVARAEARLELDLRDDAPLLVHLGSFGCNCLLDEMLDFFRIYRERHPTARFLFIAPSGEELLRRAALERGIADGIHFRSAAREEVPRLLGAADLGIMFIRPVWSKKAASPTKLGEMLAVSLPVVGNSGVGDVAEVLLQTDGGVSIETFNDSAYDAAIAQLEALDGSPGERREKARHRFDLARGIDAYGGIYQRLGSGAEPARAAASMTSISRGA